MDKKKDKYHFFRIYHATHLWQHSNDLFLVHNYLSYSNMIITDTYIKNLVNDEQMAKIVSETKDGKGNKKTNEKENQTNYLLYFINLTL